MLNLARHRQAIGVKADYVVTPKNQIVRDFLKECGARIVELEDGKRMWEIGVEQLPPNVPDYIRVIRE